MDFEFSFLISLLSGLGLSSFLYVQQRALLIGLEPPNICEAYLGASCDETLLAGHNLLGLGWPDWGILYFAILLILLAVGSFVGGVFREDTQASILLLSVLGTGISIWLVATMLSAKGNPCPLCLIVHLINAVAFVLSWIQVKGKGLKPIAKALGKAIIGGVYLLSGNATDPAQAKWHLIAFLMVAAIGLGIYQRLLISMPLASADAHATSLKAIPDQYLQIEKLQIPIDERDPRMGKMGGKVQLVIFSDFECPYCSSFAEVAEGWVQKYPDYLEVVFKHYPLGKGCNPMMQDDIHPYSCQAALASIAAHQQGKFWAYHDSLFSTDTETAYHGGIAEELQMDITQFWYGCHEQARSMIS